jgi:hypothetical protein
MLGKRQICRPGAAQKRQRCRWHGASLLSGYRHRCVAGAVAVWLWLWLCGCVDDCGALSLSSSLERVCVGVWV